MHPAQAFVTAYLTAISTRDIAALPDYFSPTATWWTSGNPVRVPNAGGPKPVEEHLPLLTGLLGLFDEYAYDVVNMVGEGGNVMVEAQARGVLGDIIYVNNITSAFAVERTGGRAGQWRIESVREYPDHKEIEWLKEQLASLPSE
ncbi:uncharacterized protein F5Z01DRAFT_676443 [Emericellopsis atlantica]|uniref:SnoaL-like domain-containing protein n=1 Tax=Emericellopsis atlantica TaxID=2614577 RepID=A0A9P8CLP4_9HYPO|nr:uncharacterized protein F5Z01DRAFT_676443 [Emericellopsis atlantica]KAG9251864.1 hypothetical protein F5Z01DRAFT_676443 [Emericellopsis atlantica]